MASTIACFLLDISPGMEELVWDEATDRMKSKLDLCKEYISRKIAPKIQSGRKTEHAGLITFGGPTNNPFFSENAAPTAEADDPADYVGVASIFPPQQAKPGMLMRVKEIEVGDQPGNPIAAMIVVDEILRMHAATKKSRTWRKEVFLMLNAQSKVMQSGWEDVVERILDRGIILRVIGVGFDERGTEEMDEVELKKLPKLERFWRLFNDKLAEQLAEAPTMDNELFAPALGDIFEALGAARGPQVTVVNSALGKTNIRIGDTQINTEEGIDIPIRHSKATMVARPMSLKKVIAKEVPKVSALPASVFQSGSQSQAPAAAKVYSQMGSAQYQTGADADLTRYVKHVVMRRVDEDVKAEPMDVDGEEHFPTGKMFQAEDVVDVDTMDDGAKKEDEAAQAKYEEVEVDKENIVKAYKFGDQWIPIKEEDFEQMETIAGMDVMGFMRAEYYQRYQSMGEVYYLWPEPDSARSQLVFSSLVQAMLAKKAVMLVRWVQKANAAPRVGAAVPMQDPDGTEYMCWTQLPFAEDERNFLFPSLSKLVSKGGKEIKEHKLLPTDEQLLLMDKLVGEMDLDDLAVEEEDGSVQPWFTPQSSYNPAIHRIKEAVFHQAVTTDLNTDPVPKPHPALLKYLHPPGAVVDRSQKTVKQLKAALDIKVAPPKAKRGEKKEGKEVVPDEEVDIDALFGGGGSSGKGDQKANADGSQKPKVKAGESIIGDDFPLKDFKAAIESGGDIVERAIKDLGEVIKKMISGSFAKSRYKTALECLGEMRHQAMRMEEVDLYNDYINDLEDFVNSPASKVKDFWKSVEAADPPLLMITPAEAEAALE